MSALTRNDMRSAVGESAGRTVTGRTRGRSMLAVTGTVTQETLRAAQSRILRGVRMMQQTEARCDAESHVRREAARLTVQTMTVMTQ